MKVVLFILVLISAQVARADAYDDMQNDELRRLQIEFLQNQDLHTHLASRLVLMDKKTNTYCPEYMSQEQAQDCIRRILNTK
jgi:hypothetical protein